VPAGSKEERISLPPCQVDSKSRHLGKMGAHAGCAQSLGTSRVHLAPKERTSDVEQVAGGIGVGEAVRNAALQSLAILVRRHRQARELPDVGSVIELANSGAAGVATRRGTGPRGGRADTTGGGLLLPVVGGGLLLPVVGG